MFEVVSFFPELCRLLVIINSYIIYGVVMILYDLPASKRTSKIFCSWSNSTAASGLSGFLSG